MRVAEAYGVRIPMTVEERIDIARQLRAKISSIRTSTSAAARDRCDHRTVVELARKAEIATPMIDAVYRSSPSGRNTWTDRGPGSAQRMRGETALR